MIMQLQTWKRSLLGRLLYFSGLIGIGFLIISFIVVLGSFFFVIFFYEVMNRIPSHYEAFLWLFLLPQASFALPTIYAVRRMTHLEQRPFASIGLRFHRSSLREFTLGVILATIPASSSFLYLYFSEKISITWDPNPELFFEIMVLGGVGWLGVAMWEELYFRGYLVQTLSQGIGLYGAAALTSIYFGLIHIITYGVTPLVIAEATVAGLFLTLLYFKTKSLWAPIGWHLGNNFLLAHVLPIPIETLIQEIPWVKINGQPLRLEVPKLFFQVELAEGESLLSWEMSVIAILAYVVISLMVWKLPWFRPHPEMEALWRQYVKSAQPWARLREWWWQKRRREADGGD